MELRHLEHFLAVAETGSFTRAATVVHVGQSALSASVRALEKQLGTRLFDRTTHSVDLTEAGTALIAEARHTLQAAEAARDAVAAVSGGTRGTLRIGIMHSMTAIDLAGLLSRFRIERPLVRIEPHTHPSGSAGLIDAVAEHRLDVAIAALPTPPRADITVTNLVSEPIELACPPADPFAVRRRVRLSELSGRRFIDVPLGWGSRTSVDLLFAQHGLTRDVDVEVADVATVVQLVQAGLGLALVAPSSAPAEERTRLIPVHPCPVFTISLVTATDRPLSAAVQAFVDLAHRSLGRSDDATRS